MFDKYMTGILHDVLAFAQAEYERRTMRKSLRFWERELANAMRVCDRDRARVAQEQYDRLMSMYV